MEFWNYETIYWAQNKKVIQKKIKIFEIIYEKGEAGANWVALVLSAVILNHPDKINKIKWFT